MILSCKNTEVFPSENWKFNHSRPPGPGAHGRGDGLGLLGIRVKKVDLAAQEQFAAFVAQTDKSKLAVQQGLKELEILKKSLMQQYFG